MTDKMDINMAESKPLVIKPEIPVKRGRGRPFGSKKKVIIIQNKDFFLRPLGRPTQDAVILEQRGPGGPLESPNQDGVILEKRGPGRPPEMPNQDRVILEKRGPGRPPERSNQDRVIPEKRGPGRPPERPNQDRVIPEKRGPGRPPLNRPPNWKSVHKKPTTSLQGFEDQKRGRGRPRKNTSVEIELLKANNQAEKREIKKNNITPITGGDKKKNKMFKDKRCILASKNNVVKATGVASVTVVVGGKPRGRPRKIKQNEDNNAQVPIFNPDIWTSPLKYEQHQFHPSSGFLHPYGPGYPTEMRFISSETGLLQGVQEANSPSMNPHSSWESRELIDEEDDSREIQEHQYPSWESQPAAQWMQGAAEYSGSTLEHSPVTQWVMGRTAASRDPPSQYSPEPLGEQPNHHEGLITELADFKCQLLKELAATRAEIREGAQLVRSAIAGVSAEISRLGQILQPLVSAITPGTSSRQDRPMAFVPRFQQDTPPDDIVDIVQPSTPVRTSLSNQSVFASPSSTASDLPAAEARSVKLEESTEGPQHCVHRTLALEGPHACHPTDIDHQRKSCHSKATSLAAMGPVNCPQDGTASDLCTVPLSPKVPTAGSLPPSSPVVCVDHSSPEILRPPSLNISEAR